MSKENELLPCPFCGGKAFLNKEWEETFGFFGECSECESSTYYSLSREEAVKAWNRRVYPDDVQEAIGKQTLKRVEVPKSMWEGVGFLCPCCSAFVVNEYGFPYIFCMDCGQKIDWSECDEEKHERENREKGSA